MPMIDLTVPRGALTPEHTDHLIKELSRIIIEWEGAEDIPSCGCGSSFLFM